MSHLKKSDFTIFAHQKFLMRYGKSKQWEYSSGECTDQSPETMIVQSVRARLMNATPQEVPYLLKFELEYYSVHKGKEKCRRHSPLPTYFNFRTHIRYCARILSG